MTDQFIKMCIAAKEIQAVWEPKEGDRTMVGDKPLMLPAAEVARIARMLDPGGELVKWLPTQEDLWGMMIRDRTMTPVEISHFWTFLNFHYWPPASDVIKHIEIPSVSELLLAFVMHELHNKKWTGTEWISTEE